MLCKAQVRLTTKRGGLVRSCLLLFDPLSQFFRNLHIPSLSYLITTNIYRKTANFDTCMVDLSALVAKAQALGAQLLAAQRSARQRKYFFQKDNSSLTASSSSLSSSSAAINRARMLRKSNRAVIAELVTTAQLEPRDPAPPSSSSASLSPQAPPHGSLIRAENWTDMHDAAVLRRRGHTRGQNSRRTVTAIGSRKSQEQQQEQPGEDRHNNTNSRRQKSGCKEQVSCHEDLFERHFQSLDRALLAGGACPAGAANNNHNLRPAGKLLVILEQVKEEEENEEASSVSQGTSGGLWEVPESDITLAEEHCPLECGCEARKESGRTAREHDARVGSVVRQRSNEDDCGPAAARGSSSCPPTAKTFGDQGEEEEEEAYSVRRVLSSSSSSSSSTLSVPNWTATAKVLDVPERRSTTPPPPYVASM